MAFQSREQNRTCATLSFVGSPPVTIDNEVELRGKLAALSMLAPRQSAVLSRDAKHYIKAERWGELWSVTVRKGGFWTLASFSAALSTDWSARQVREHRAAKSFLAWILKSPPPERALSIEQVETLFVEFLVGRKFSLPFSGA